MSVEELLGGRSCVAGAGARDLLLHTEVEVTDLRVIKERSPGSLSPDDAAVEDSSVV